MVCRCGGARKRPLDASRWRKGLAVLPLIPVSCSLSNQPSSTGVAALDHRLTAYVLPANNVCYAAPPPPPPAHAGSRAPSVRRRADVAAVPRPVTTRARAT